MYLILLGERASLAYLAYAVVASTGFEKDILHAMYFVCMCLGTYCASLPVS